MFESRSLYHCYYVLPDKLVRVYCFGSSQFVVLTLKKSHLYASSKDMKYGTQNVIIASHATLEDSRRNRSVPLFVNQSDRHNAAYDKIDHKV